MTSARPRTAIVLAAGLGTRLGSIGRSTPKVLLDVGGKTLLERHLDYLAAHGVRHVVVNAHHHAGRIRSFLEERELPVEAACLVEERLLGTAGAVRNALPYLEPGPFVVLYGDVVITESLHPLIDTHVAERAVATLAVHETASPEGKGVVEVDGRGRVTRFVEKGPPVSGPALVNSGVYVLEAELVASFPRADAIDFGHDVFPRAVSAGVRVFSRRLEQPVVDVGTPEGLAQARADAEHAGAPVRRPRATDG